jgi:glycosyltransferase involved in cell wall biosynthesis
MVVAEAMAVGVPAIVSTNTGAKEMIEQFPGSGWVIDATEQDIYDSIKKVINGEWDVKEAGEKALDAAKYFTWESYRKRVVDILKDVMDD